MITIGITGTNGAGKGVAVSYLMKNGFAHYAVRDFLVAELERRNMEVVRDNMVIVANELRREHGPSYIIERLYEQAERKGQDAVIESIRAMGEVNYLRSKDNFYLISVDANQRTRYDRIVKRNSVSDRITFEKFVSDDNKEKSSVDVGRQSISECIRTADFKLENDASFNEFYAKVDEALKKIRSGRSSSVGRASLS
jgi:dephospho-CoA kinase